MAQSDAQTLLFGLAVLVGMGFLLWKVALVSGVSTGRTKTTSFSRDEEGRITEIIELEN